MNYLPPQKVLTLFACIVFIALGCTKKETEKDFKGNLEVRINPFNEFYSTNKINKDGFSVTLKGTEPEMTVISDTSGLCRFENVPLGNYILIAEKEGFEKKKEHNFVLLENSSTKSVILHMGQRSTTKIKNYSLSLRNDTINITGTISHNHHQAWAMIYPHTWPKVKVFVSNKPDVSCFNYLRAVSILAKANNDTIISGDIKIGNLNLSAGVTLYVVGYGELFDTYDTYDYELGVYYNPRLGAPSEIKSIVIP